MATDIEAHSYGEVYAKDLEAYGNPRVALNRHGEPAKTRAGAVRLAVVTSVESLPGYRTRITLDTGRTMTVPDGRWILAEHSAWRSES